MDQFLKRFPAPGQLGHDRSDRDFQPFADLGVTFPIAIPENDDFSTFFAHRVNQSFQ